MPEQQPTATGAEPVRNPDTAVSVTETGATSTPRFHNEWEFTKAVENLAKQFGWEEPFHIPAVAYSAAIDAGHPVPAGFPDLVLRYRDSGGKSTVIIAELKTDAEDSLLEPEQRKFLEDFAAYVPAFVWRPRDWGFIKSVLRDGPPEATGQIIEPSPLTVRVREWLPPEQTISAIIYKLVDDIGRPDFPRGDLAGLRRMNPEEPRTTAFYKLMGEQRLLDAANPEVERKWGLILHGIALMTRTAGVDLNSRSAHNRNMPVGRALYLGGESARATAFYSETRFNRLLNAREDMLRVLLGRMFRMAAAGGVTFNWWEMANFIRNADFGDGEAAELSRRRLARDYYQAQRRATSQSGNTDND